MTLMQQHCEAQLTLLPADSPASRSVLPGSDEAIRMTVQSGRKCSALLHNAGPAGLLLKTLLESSGWRSTTFCFRWKAKATRRGRLYFQLAPVARGTSASGYSLLPTPTAAMAGGGGSIREAARAMRGEKRESGASVSLRLPDYVKLFPTPTAQDAKNSTLPPSQMERNSIPGMLMREGASGSLNPQWVEWLMGYPEDWTLPSD